MGLSFTHLLLLAGILYLIFGTKKVPELGKSMGEAIRGFKKGLSGDDQRDVTPNDQLSQSEDPKKK